MRTMVKIGLKPQVPPVHQPDAEINITNPTLDLLYEVLAATPFARINGIEIEYIGAPESTQIEVHMMVDGVAYLFYLPNPISMTKYYCNLWMSEAQNNQPLHTTDRCYYRAFLIEGHNIRVQALISGGNPTNLFCRVRWSRWP